ncbi:FixJ family two-component response regulator [Oxalobacteraceae bacterium GrIS 2.11]
MNSLIPWVAIVDDDELVRRSLLRLLDLHSFTAAGFESGDTFLDALRISKPACVVLDLHMTALNGFEVQKQLAQLSAETSVIFVTGSDSLENRRQAFSCSPIAYFAKPVAAGLLLETVASGIRQCEVKRQTSAGAATRSNLFNLRHRY